MCFCDLCECVLQSLGLDMMSVWLHVLFFYGVAYVKSCEFHVRKSAFGIL